MAVAEITANKEGWEASQCFELKFWRESWPYRDWDFPRIQELRHGDAEWLMRKLNFPKTGPRTFQDFEGTCLEVGCGPLGFFELVENVETTAIDTLMGPYAKHLSFSTLGKRGNSTYLDQDIAEIKDQFDFVVCSNVLDHTGDWIEFLEMLVERVKPGGQLLLMTDTRGAPIEGHTQVYTPSQLRRVLVHMKAKEFLHFRIEDPVNGHCDKQVYCRVKF